MGTKRPREFIPLTRTQALSLLRTVDDDVSRLSSFQILAIREVYHLNDNKTVEQLVREYEGNYIEVSSHRGSCGKCTTDGSLCGLIGTPECKMEDRA